MRRRGHFQREKFSRSRQPPPAAAAGFSIAPGEVLGLVGESGSGKSVASLSIMRLLPAQARATGQVSLCDPDGGSRDLLAVAESEMRAIRGARIGMIFQEPMTALNPVMRVGDQIAEAVLAHGVPRYVIEQIRRDNANTKEWFRTPVPLSMLQHLAGGLGVETKLRRDKLDRLVVEALRDVGIPDPERRVRSYPHQLSGGMRQRVMI